MLWSSPVLTSIVEVFQGILNTIISAFQSIFAVSSTIIADLAAIFKGVIEFVFCESFCLSCMSSQNAADHRAGSVASHNFEK